MADLSVYRRRGVTEDSARVEVRIPRHPLRGFVVLWPLILTSGPFFYLHLRPDSVSPWVTAIFALIALATAYAFVHERIEITRARFESGRFTLRSGPLLPRRSLDLALDDIREFRARIDVPEDSAGEGHAVYAGTRDDQWIRLPISLAGAIMTSRGGGTIYVGGVPMERAAAVATMLQNALERVRGPFSDDQTVAASLEARSPAANVPGVRVASEAPGATRPFGLDDEESNAPERATRTRRLP